MRSKEGGVADRNGNKWEVAMGEFLAKKSLKLETNMIAAQRLGSKDLDTSFLRGLDCFRC